VHCEIKNRQHGYGDRRSLRPSHTVALPSLNRMHVADSWRYPLVMSPKRLVHSGAPNTSGV
jgi:hypothetical protein